MFEGYYSPPFYTDLYNFKDGAQNDIFIDSYDEIPPPSPNSTIVPTPVARPLATSTPSASIAAATPASTSSANNSTSTASVSGGHSAMWYVDYVISSGTILILL